MSRSSAQKTGLILTVALLCVIAAFILLDKHPPVDQSTPPLPPGNTEASITIEEFRQSATRDGRTEWTLEANSASLLPLRKIVALKRIRMTFFMNDGTTVMLSADEGTLNTSTKNIDIRGGVVIEHDRLRLHTELLQYTDNHRILFSSHPTTITEDSLRLTADSFALDLKKNRIEFIGHVNCMFTRTP